MLDSNTDAPAARAIPACSGTGTASPPYEPPAFEVIALACEVSAYAPDGGESDPLF